jgi:hypothetical protein
MTRPLRLTFELFVNIGKDRWTRARFVAVFVARFIAQITFTAWALSVWVHVKDYGLQHECNDGVKYVFMFFTVKATKYWLRGLWIAVLVINTAWPVLGFGMGTLYRLARTKVELKEEVAGEEEEDEREESCACGVMYLIAGSLYVISFPHGSNAHQ